MQSRSIIEIDTIARWVRAAVALSVSLAVHGGIAYAMINAASVYGRSNASVPSLSVEAVHTIVLEEVTPTDDLGPPPESAHAAASVAANTPSPDQHVPETQTEKPEPPAAAEPVQVAAHQPPASAEPVEPQPEPAVAAPQLPTVDQPEASEVSVAKADPEAVLEAQRREQERLKAEADLARQREAEDAERKRKIAEAKAAEKREVDEKERKRKAAQHAREARKAKGAEHNQRASVASRGQKQDTRGAARTTASRGDILSYAALVRARVASNKPGGSGSGGTVVVSFGVSGSGGLAYVRINRSSGQSGLDQAALAAVRRSGPFPAPPDGQSHAFSVPFHFN